MKRPIQFIVSIFLLGCAAVHCQVEVARAPYQVKSEGNISVYRSEELDLPAVTLTHSFKVGAGTSDFKLPFRTSLAGFGGPFRRLFLPNYEQIGGRFFAFAPYEREDLIPRLKAFLVSGSTEAGQPQTFAILSMDTIAVTADVASKLLRRLQKEFPELRLTHHNTQFVATHTHSAPGGLSQHPFWTLLASDTYSPEIYGYFENAAVAAVRNAITLQAPLSQVQLRKGELIDLNKSRTPFMDVERQASQLQFLAEGRVHSCFEFFAVHPTWFTAREKTLSSDLAGHLERAWNRELGSENCFFLTTSVGNAEAVKTASLEEYTQKYIREANRYVPAPALQTGEDIQYGAQLVRLGAAQFNENGCDVEPPVPFLNLPVLNALPQQTKLSFLRIGKTVMVFVPGEPDHLVGREIEVTIREAFASIDHVIIVSVSNDYTGYYVTPDEYKRKSIESCSSLYGSEIGGKILSQSVNMLRSAGLD